jgi:hypothetical protein
MAVSKEFLKICDYQNLLHAAKIIRKRKLHISGQREFFTNLEENIIELQNELLWRLYFPQMPVPHFRDVIVQVALFNALEHDYYFYINDFYTFALLENVLFSKIVHSKKIVRLLNPFRSKAGRRRKWRRFSGGRRRGIKA